MEWKNAGFYTEIFVDSISTDYTNFQLWLYEFNGIIQFRYGESQILDPENSYDENPGIIAGLSYNLNFNSQSFPENSMWIIGDPESPSIARGDLDYMTGIPADRTVYTFVPEGVSNKSIRAADIAIWPSPADKEIHFQLTDEQSLKLTAIQLADLSGNTIACFPAQHRRLDISNLPAGIYFLKFISTDGMQTQKLIKY